MKFNHPSLGLCGQALVLNPDNSIKLHYGPYLARVMNRIEMDDVHAALSPDIEELFDPSTDPTPLSPPATSEFRTVNGELIHVLPVVTTSRKSSPTYCPRVKPPTTAITSNNSTSYDISKEPWNSVPHSQPIQPTTQTVLNSIHPPTSPPTYTQTVKPKAQE
jgi:hypothetical protein